jgi:hypothetical protein
MFKILENLDSKVRAKIKDKSSCQVEVPDAKFLYYHSILLKGDILQGKCSL